MIGKEFRQKEFIDSVKKWNGKHKGGDIYVIGSSPKILEITEKQLKNLSNSVVIGGNLTYIKVPLTYMFSSYLMHCLLAKSYMLNKKRIIKLNTIHEYKYVKEYPEFAQMLKGPYDEINGLSKEFTNQENWISTHLNQALGMTHLALVMGAKRIIYIGVDQGMHNYFWMLDSSLKSRVLNLLYIFQSRYHDLLRDEAIRTILTNTFSIINSEPNSRDSLKYVFDHTDLFRSYFGDLKQHGVEPIATSKESIIAKAGASYISLADLLER